MGKELKYLIDESTGCHICISHKPNKLGYIVLSDNQYLHRKVYKDNFGSIPEGMVIRHTCDHRACANPEHLTAGTQAENIQDKVIRNRQSKGTHRPDAKLNDEKALFILNSDMKYKKLAELFNVSETVIKFIKTRRTWKHIQLTTEA